jgi:3-oxoadipate enol-lactonase
MDMPTTLLTHAPIAGISRSTVCPPRTVWADRPAIVLIHGFSASAHWWAHNVPSLSNHFRVYALDLFRKSDGAEFILADAVARVVDWMEAEEIGQAHFVGHSMGGMIAAQLAAEFSNYVDRLVLVNPVVHPLRQSLLEAALGTVKGFATSPRELRAIALKDALRPGPITQIRTLVSLLETDIRPKLGGISAKTLIVWGRTDPILPQSDATAIRSAIPGSKLVWLEAGHNLMWERSGQFNRLLLRFLGVHGRSSRCRPPSPQMFAPGESDGQC